MKRIYVIFSEETGVKVKKIDSVSESYKNILHSNYDDYDSKSNVQTFAICLFYIAQWAAKYWIIARSLEFSYP